MRIIFGSQNKLSIYLPMKQYASLLRFNAPFNRKICLAKVDKKQAENSSHNSLRNLFISKDFIQYIWSNGFKSA